MEASRRERTRDYNKCGRTRETDELRTFKALPTAWVLNGCMAAAAMSFSAAPHGEHLSIPARRLIKPVYITQFLPLAASAKEANDECSQE